MATLLPRNKRVSKSFKGCGKIHLPNARDFAAKILAQVLGNAAADSTKGAATNFRTRHKLYAVNLPLVRLGNLHAGQLGTVGALQSHVDCREIGKGESLKCVDKKKGNRDNHLLSTIIRTAAINVAMDATTTKVTSALSLPPFDSACEQEEVSKPQRDKQKRKTYSKRHKDQVTVAPRANRVAADAALRKRQSTSRLYH